MKRFVAILVALLVLSTQSAFSEERTLNIVFIPKAGDQDFWKFMRKGVDRAVAESGNVRLTWHLAVLKHITLNLIRLDPTPRKGGIKARRLIAATSDLYRAQLLGLA